MAEVEENIQHTEWVMVSDLVQCMLCYNTIKQAKVLSSCRHMFCFDCLLHWWEESPDSNMTSVACPICRQICALPTEGISALPSDMKVSKLGEMLKQCIVVVNEEEKASKTDSATGTGVALPPCDVCNLDTDRDSASDLNNANRHCEDCGNYLCESCSLKHDATSVFARHKVVDLRKAKPDAQILCSKHPGKPLKYLCYDCPSIACSVCVTTQHLGHDVVEIKDMIDHRKALIRNMLHDIKKMSEILDNRMALTEELVMQTKDIYWAVAKKITDHADRCRKEIEEAENRLLEELETKKNVAVQRTREEGNKRKYNITELDSLGEYVEKFLNTEPLAFVSNCEELMDKMATILQSKDKGIVVDLQGVGTRFIVQQGLLSLGRLQDESASRMRLELKKKKKPVYLVPDALIKIPSGKTEDKIPKEISGVAEGSKAEGENSGGEEKGDVCLQEQGQKGSPVDEPIPEVREETESKVVAVQAAGKPPTAPPKQQATPKNKFEFMPFLLEYCINFRSLDIQKQLIRGSSTSSSTDGDPKQIMPHSGQPHAKKIRGRSSSLAERRSGPRDQRRHSVQYEKYRHHGGGEKRESRGRPVSKMIPNTNIIQVKEGKEGPKLLWEASTAVNSTDSSSAEGAEGEVSEASRPRDVAFAKNGDIYVLNDSQQNLVHFPAAGGKCDVISGDFTSPMCVVVTRDGQPAVSDSQEHCIKLFSPDGASYTVWDLENIMASGMTVTESSKWLVLDKIGDVFGIYPEPGAKCITHVPLTKHLLYTERYMACDSKGRIFVSGSEDTTVAAFDPDGRHLMDIGGPGSQGGYVSVPRGLYVDQRDNLIVADRHNHRVTMFSPDGRFMQHICPYEKMVWPTGIDFMTPENGGSKMAVTVSDSLVQIYDVSMVM